MKTKETVDSKFIFIEKKPAKSKPKSLKPMRSMVAVRSLRPKAVVAQFIRSEESSQT